MCVTGMVLALVQDWASSAAVPLCFDGRPQAPGWGPPRPPSQGFCRVVIRAILTIFSRRSDLPHESRRLALHVNQRLVRAVRVVCAAQLYLVLGSQ